MKLHDAIMLLDSYADNPALLSLISLERPDYDEMQKVCQSLCVVLEHMPNPLALFEGLLERDEHEQNATCEACGGLEPVSNIRDGRCRDCHQRTICHPCCGTGESACYPGFICTACYGRGVVDTWEED